MRKLYHDEILNLQQIQCEKKRRFPVSAILENIRSLYNVGSMFRTADGAGLQKLYLCGYTASPPRPEIEKSALGSTQNVSWERFEETLTLIRYLKSQGEQIVVFEHCENSKPYNQIEYHSPCTLVFGNEVNGVSAEVCALADEIVLIPMYGIKQSLNVSVSFGIGVYNATALLNRGE
ncbi:MAG: RNA methyltransferase [Spirochaetes bacterium]|jgi:tRNA G18 (ribose-2'-O)-methylase SpoU|nr:RNA methyltransferase [Spirochaetota bacterium]